MGPMDGMNMMGMGLFWVLLLVALIAFVVWLVSRGRGSTSATRSSAEDVLRDRYASGEIDAEEYRERRAELRRD